MERDQQNWLRDYAVTCRVFKGRWSIRHCLRMYNDIKDLKIQMSSRAKGKVTRHESAYNPCEHCRVLDEYRRAQCIEERYPEAGNVVSDGVWAV